LYCNDNLLEKPTLAASIEKETSRHSDSPTALPGFFILATAVTASLLRTHFLKK
jgi:hypothetical protein